MQEWLALINLAGGRQVLHDSMHIFFHRLFRFANGDALPKGLEPSASLLLSQQAFAGPGRLDSRFVVHLLLLFHGGRLKGLDGDGVLRHLAGSIVER